MSKRWGYVCQTHDPVIVSSHWLNHGSAVLAEVYRRERAGEWPNVPETHPAYLAYKGEPLAVRNDLDNIVGDLGGGHSDYHTSGPVEWLREHPKCLVALHNEYGDVEPLETGEHLRPGYADRPGVRASTGCAGALFRAESDVTILEFLEARIETDRGEAQYTLNLLESSTPVMLGSLRSTIINTCLRVLADVETKLAIIELHAGDHRCGHWPTGCPTIRRLAADYSEHSDYQRWL